MRSFDLKTGFLRISGSVAIGVHSADLVISLSSFLFLKKKYLFIWLCWVFVAACGIFDLPCGPGDLYVCVCVCKSCIGDNGGGQRGLVCCSPWGCKESDMTGWLNKNNNKSCRTWDLGFPGGSMAKNLPADAEGGVRSLGQEDLLDK